MSACDACLRRCWLIARLAGRIEVARHDAQRLPEVLALGEEQLLSALGGDDATRIDEERRRFDAAEARRTAAAASLDVVCAHDERYPATLLHARDAPAVLHVGGGMQRLARIADDASPAVAIVGTRRATAEGLEVARAIGRDLALAGVPVISGMALGIDSAAQTGAVDAGGLSAAILAGGADVAYPRSRGALHRRLVAGGLVLSEAPPGARPWRWGFPARNRIIAGLADLTVVVEAAERSGSLITADLAVRLGRDVAAVPGPVTSPVAAGTNALLKDGAILVRDAQDVLDAVFGVGAAPRPIRLRGDDLEPHLAAALDAVALGNDTAGALAAAAALPIDQAFMALSHLEVRGLLTRRADGRYAVAL